MNKGKSKYWIANTGRPLMKDLRYPLTGDAMEWLCCEVIDAASITRNTDLAEEALSCLLGNLLHTDLIGESVVYSRNANGYSIERGRYGYEWYRYKMVVRLVDAMYRMGLPSGVKGRIEPNRKRNRPSKMWATERIQELFTSEGKGIFIKRSTEVLLLKDENKALKNYNDNNHTHRMRRQLRELNEMLGSIQIDFTFTYKGLSSMPGNRAGKLMKIRSMLLTGQIEIIPVEVLRVSEIERDRFKPHTKEYSAYDHDALLNKQFNGIEFKGVINQGSNWLRRIFNIDWKHGGRFYQAPHITIPSACREHMTIDGEAAVELDYSGMHIRMLYHLIGIDYRSECYVFHKGDQANKPDRERIKIASLITINCKDIVEAIPAIHNQCRKKWLHYKAGNYGLYSRLISLFQVHHERISQFLLTGKGLELQYLDSTIMSNILGRMLRQGIPALPVHDSVICPARHQDFLYQVMIEEYQKVIGFEPVIG